MQLKMRQPPRWQDEGTSLSFRACAVNSIDPVLAAIKNEKVDPKTIAHLDLAENQIHQQTHKLKSFRCLLSLDLAHNSVENLQIDSLPAPLLHLNLSYNRLEDVNAINSLHNVVELNLSYNLLTSIAPLETLTNLQVLLAAGNRLSECIGLTGLTELELLDMRHNYISKIADVRPLALNTKLRTLSLVGNPVAKQAGFRSAIINMLPTLYVLDGQKTPRSSLNSQRDKASSTPSSVQHTRYGTVHKTPSSYSSATRLQSPSQANTGATTLSKNRPAAIPHGSLESNLRRSSSANSLRFGPSANAGQPLKAISSVGMHSRALKEPSKTSQLQPHDGATPIMPAGSTPSIKKARGTHRLAPAAAASLIEALKSKQSILQELATNGEKGDEDAQLDYTFASETPKQQIAKSSTWSSVKASAGVEFPGRSTPSRFSSASRRSVVDAALSGVSATPISAMGGKSASLSCNRAWRGLHGSLDQASSLGSSVELRGGMFSPSESGSTLLESLLRLAAD